MNRRSFFASLPLLVAGAALTAKQPTVLPVSNDKEWLLFDCDNNVPLDEFESTDSFELLLSRISQEVNQHGVDALSVYVNDHWRWCPVRPCLGQPGFRLEAHYKETGASIVTFQMLYDSTQVLMHSPRSRSQSHPLMFAAQA